MAKAPKANQQPEYRAQMHVAGYLVLHIQIIILALSWLLTFDLDLVEGFVSERGVVSQRHNIQNVLFGLVLPTPERIGSYFEWTSVEKGQSAWCYI